MHGSLLSNAAKFTLMNQKRKDTVSSREVGSMLLKDFLPNGKEMKIQESGHSRGRSGKGRISFSGGKTRAC